MPDERTAASVIEEWVSEGLGFTPLDSAEGILAALRDAGFMVVRAHPACEHGIRHPVTCPQCEPEIYEAAQPQVTRWARERITSALQTLSGVLVNNEKPCSLCGNPDHAGIHHPFPVNFFTGGPDMPQRVALAS